MEQFKEYSIEIDTTTLGIWRAGWPNLRGIVIGESTIAQAVIGKGLIVLLDEPSALQVGRRGIAVFESQVKVLEE